jgi:hypothetical protein
MTSGKRPHRIMRQAQCLAHLENGCGVKFFYLAVKEIRDLDRVGQHLSTGRVGRLLPLRYGHSGFGALHIVRCRQPPLGTGRQIFKQNGVAGAPVNRQCWHT